MTFQKRNPVPDYDPNLPTIYTGWSGYRVQEFTYSQAVDIDKCGYYTRATRIEGWQPILDGAGLRFGECIETSVRQHYEDNYDPVDVFNVEWGKYKDVQLMYREREEDWNNLLQIGRALLRQFPRVRETIFPFTNMEFSLHPVKKSWYKGSNLGYIADMIVHQPGEDILIDLKTSGVTYLEKEDARGWPAMDMQLLTGSLITGIREVGFLVALKLKNPRWQFMTGTVTDELLRDHEAWLRAQFDKYERKEFYRRTGLRFPNTHCSFCDLLPRCLGREDLVQLTLRQKSKKETTESWDALGAMD